MERRILAELFVEDDRAIEMDKGTIDYAKDVIRPSAKECAQNGRARSTKMRWAIKK